MRIYVILRTVLILTSICLGLSLFTFSAFGQDVGADVGGGAGIFRPKNPETKRANKPTSSSTKPSSRTTSRSTRATTASVADRVEELLDKGNQFRDSRRFAEAEESYQSVLKLKPRDARAAYGLGNIYSDQQRWENAELAYRNAVGGNLIQALASYINRELLAGLQWQCGCRQLAVHSDQLGSKRCGRIDSDEGAS